MNIWEMASERRGSAQDTLRPTSQHKRDAFAVEGQRAGTKKPKDRRQEMREGEGHIGRGEGIFAQRDNGRPLERGGIGAIHRKMAVYHRKGETRVRMSSFILTGHVNYGGQRGLVTSESNALIAGPGSQPQEEEVSNKLLALGSQLWEWERERQNL